MDRNKIEDLSNLEELKEIPIEQIKTPENEKGPLFSSIEKEKINEGQNLEKQEKNEKNLKRNKIEDPNLASQNNSKTILKKREDAIDNILADGLSNIFLKMNKTQQQEFKEKGEQTAKKINVLLSDAKTRANKIIDLIRKWLKLIPGVNKFFIEQETKLKADKIMKIRNDF